ncbi:enoyl-CoA hydratase/isomerase family protein [Halalkaliarchaeum sp. AArc-GB]|uniref:enoyl-CoA hydratase/isomerase family protein n=1 Tax=Halalkaliarchaeum sp. AArc-GB TaxID=3074078 RepID=UPI002861414F|nr:enoyl-CoA hydratase/isomerase family protein [Halalkaliarchaeum sp. AArc-GB]MDR5672241.1 enoyl-CoA hydratase/isomerase family protein [Halalkaliarchaeum sp. AArc-GB]
MGDAVVTVRTSKRERIRTIELANPDRRNAVTPGDLTRLESAISHAERTGDPVVYLAGAGAAFCAGADLETVVSLSDPAGFARHGARVARRIDESDPVVVAGIDGPARGGGVELALACDLRIATPEATFAESGVLHGLFGAWGGTVRLPRIVGEGNALDLSLSGRTIDAQHAHRIGLVSRITDDPFDVAIDLAERPADALRGIKRRVRDRSDVDAQERAEAELFARLHDRHGETISR